MRNNIFRVFPFFLFVLLTINLYSQDTCDAIADGDWDDASTWSCTGTATYPDLTVSTINIDNGYTIDIIGNQGLFNFSSPPASYDTISVTINLGGILNFGPGFGVTGQLFLESGSKIIFSSTGRLNSDNFFGFDYIIIGGNNVWEGGDGDITGPGVLDENSSNGVLPIELISFNANLNGEVVEILWATASETNNEFYTLERSDDGVNWDIIGEVDGAGNSSERLDYNFTDFDPTPGLSYYRLKQTDYDGKLEYFAPVVVLYEPDNLFKVFPNPTVDVIQLTTSSDLKNARILIKDLGGKLKISNVAYSPHQASVDLTALPTGVYILEILFPESVLSRRIVKN